MNGSIIPSSDIEFIASQSAGKMNLIVSGMTSLLNENDAKVEMLASQDWFQRMANTITGKNRMTRDEIQRNHEKIGAYVTEALSILYEQNQIDHKIIISLGNQLNDVYEDQLYLKHMLGAFVRKLNAKIESIDNFHMLNTEIEQGVYSKNSTIVSVLNILSQLDPRTIKDERKMGIITRSLVAQGIINDEKRLFIDYLCDIENIDEDFIGTIYMELNSLRKNFLAKIMSDTVENYHFLPSIQRLIYIPR